MNRLTLLALLPLLGGCSPLSTPQDTPSPVLLLRRLDAAHVQAQLLPAPQAARWTLRASALCGATDGPAVGGLVPPSGALVLLAGRGDLLRIGGQGWAVAECAPESAWNLGRTLFPLPPEARP